MKSTSCRKASSQRERVYLVHSFTDLLQTHIKVKLLFFKVRSLLIEQFHLKKKKKEDKIIT